MNLRRLLFKRKYDETPPATHLPAEVSASIEASHVILRADAGIVLVQLPGFQPIKWSAENAREFFSSAFAELNLHQVERAVRYLAVHVRKRAAMDERVQRGPRWSDWRPAERVYDPAS